MERYPNLKEEVGGSIPNCEISSILGRNLALACRPYVSENNNNNKTNQTNLTITLFWKGGSLNSCPLDPFEDCVHVTGIDVWGI